ncbi:MAG TPA: AraC family transcriptional regulator [Microscillaceae bacterium]|nr:AraC family transcriptional regulator [Microscillaceae bacterium]
MQQVIEINKISQMHQMGGLPKPKHQLVSVIYNRDIKTTASLQGIKVINYLYTVIFKSSMICSSVSYGRNLYDYEEGTLVFTSPGQVMEFKSDTKEDEQIDPDGWSLVFHPNIFRRSDLADKINRYSFFHYDSNEALHLSDYERSSIEDLLNKIIQEYSQHLDRHSQHLIVSNIELFLDYCLRFYDRQFFSRASLNRDVISKFERLLLNYYEADQACLEGVPSVEYCAKQLNLTPNYLSDLLKKETGKTALEHIHLFLIEKAKNSLLNSSDTISGIAYSLGFEFPQRFSNLFKSKTGMSPKEYRTLN